MTGQPEANHRASMNDALATAAAAFDLTVTGTPVFGWNGRSVGASATRRSDGTQRWLRVVTEHVSWACGDWWTGNADAADIEGIPKPSVLAVRQWNDDGQVLRAEVMTHVSSRPCSTTAEVRRRLDLPPRWWTGLREAVDRLAEVRTTRQTVDQERVSGRLRIFFGDRLDTTVTHWTTAHGDLHWANLTRPYLTILDWELWGRAPYGYDAATLYCYSLLEPDVAEAVGSTFADVLRTPEGIHTQLYVITRLLLRAEHGDHPDLVIPLHRHARDLLAAVG